MTADPTSRSSDDAGPTRSGRHRGRPTPRPTPASLYWYFTQAPRPSLFGSGQDPIWPGILCAGFVLAGFAQAARDFFDPQAWWAPMRGTACLLGAIALIGLVVTYLGRPVATTQPSPVRRTLNRDGDRHDHNASAADQREVPSPTSTTGTSS